MLAEKEYAEIKNRFCFTAEHAETGESPYFDYRSTIFAISAVNS